ncbi:MAG: molybdopterin converting factor [Sedimentisphaerales bacterium]|jgi:sulfur carrier protein ThiS
MKILFIDNDGAGFADYLDIAEGTTIEQFFKIKMPGREVSDYLIRVNRQPVAKDYILQEGDRITVTPTKVEGAKR